MSVEETALQVYPVPVSALFDVLGPGRDPADAEFEEAIAPQVATYTAESSNVFVATVVEAVTGDVLQLTINSIGETDITVTVTQDTGPADGRIEPKGYDNIQGGRSQLSTKKPNRKGNGEGACWCRASAPLFCAHPPMVGIHPRAAGHARCIGSPAERRCPAPPRKAGTKPPATGREAFDRLFADAPATTPARPEFKLTHYRQ